MTINEYDDTQPDAYNTGDTVYVQQGWDVIGSDGEKVGEVAQATDNFFVVSKGFFFPTDRYIPFWAISRVENDQVFLELSKDEIDARGWDSPDAVRNLDNNDAGYAETRVVNEDTGFAANNTPSAGTGYGADPAFGDTDDYEIGRTARANRDVDDDDNMQLHEERLTGGTKSTQSGAVEIGKEVETHRESVDVPVNREEVDVEYHEYDEPRAASGVDLEDDEVRVPVSEETPVARKETVTTGEVDVKKRRVQGTERVSGEVRKERPVIRREGDVDVNVEGDDDLEETNP